MPYSTVQICEQKSYKKNQLPIEIFIFFPHYSLAINLQINFVKYHLILKNTTIEIRVRYGETDQMGIVYYGNYSLYLERGRTEWLRELGFSYKWMEANQVRLPVVHFSIDYKRPAYYDDVLTVKTALKKMPTANIEFDYEIYNESKQLLVTATTVLVFIDATTNKVMKAPDYLLKKLEVEE